MDRYRWLVRGAFPWALVLALGGTAFLPNALNPGFVTGAGLLLGGLFVLAGALTGPSRGLGRAAGAALLLVLASTAWLALGSAFADNPAVSFVGVIGLHNGTALFVLGAVWFLAAMLCADARALRRTVGVVSVSGAVFTAATLWEVLRVGPERAQGAAAGFFENSTSLGEFLAVAVFCSAIWALTTTDRRMRIAAAATGVASAAGIALASSRTGLLGLALGAAFAALVAFVPPSPWKRRSLSVGLPAFAALASGAGVAASSGWLGRWAQTAVASLGTERDSIWRSALARLERPSVLGGGLEQFSAVIRWRVGADSSFSAYATNDPHSLPLAVLLGGGVLGALLVAFAAGAVLHALLARTDHTGRSPATSLLASVPVVAVGSALVGWMAPSVMLVVAALTGAALRPTPEAAGARRDGGGLAALRLAASVLGVSALALAGVSFFALRAESTFDALPVAARTTPADAEALYRRWPEPGFIALSLQSEVPAALQGDGAALTASQRLAGEAAGDARWSVDLAAADVVLAEPDASAGASGFAAFVQTTDAEAVSDPGSGLWSAIKAVQARRLGLRGPAARYAREALVRAPDPETRSLLEAIAAGR